MSFLRRIWSPLRRGLLAWRLDAGNALNLAGQTKGNPAEQKEHKANFEKEMQVLDKARKQAKVISAALSKAKTAAKSAQVPPPPAKSSPAAGSS